MHRSKHVSINSVVSFVFVIIVISSFLLCPSRLFAMGKNKDIWLSDMSKCLPADAISRDYDTGTWLAVDYEVDEGKGVMLYGLPGSQAPELTLKLNAKGWYQIRVGIFYGHKEFGKTQKRFVCAKLSNDPGFVRFGLEDFSVRKDGDYPEKTLSGTDIAETFWRCADLTGQDLIIARPNKGKKEKLQSNIAYVRLIPMDKAEINEWQLEQPAEKTKTLIANYDGCTITGRGWTNAQDFINEFEPLRDSDFDIALYAMARGPITYYPSKVGEVIRPTGAYGRGPWIHKCIENGVDPLAEAIKAAHIAGVKLFPQNRLCGSQGPPDHVRADYGGKLMADHPEWMATYPDGEPTRHLSLAFKGVRDCYVRLMREWVEDYHADGISVIFSRSFPFVYYEQPVVDAFQEKYGEDLRKLGVMDKRTWGVRAEFVTQFLREIRAMLDEVGKAQNRYIPTCYTVPVNHSAPGYVADSPDDPFDYKVLELNMFSNLDVATWIREELVDYLDAHIHLYMPHDGKKMGRYIRDFAKLTRGTKTKLMCNVYPRRMPARQYRKIAMNYYEAGADGLAFWDSFNRDFRASEWAFVKRLGHRDDLERWKGKGDDYFRKVPIKQLDGILLDRDFAKPTDG